MSEGKNHAPGTHSHGEHASAKHATVKQYWILCVVLAIITLIEFGIFKVDSLRSNATFMLPTLLILSLIKFVIVCGWYMHLRYDHKILTKIFAFSGMMVVGVFAILILSL